MISLLLGACAGSAELPPEREPAVVAPAPGSQAPPTEPSEPVPAETATAVDTEPTAVDTEPCRAEVVHFQYDREFGGPDRQTTHPLDRFAPPADVFDAHYDDSARTPACEDMWSETSCHVGPTPYTLSAARARLAGSEHTIAGELHRFLEIEGVTYVFDDEGRTTRVRFDPSASGSDDWEYRYTYACDRP
ncbi:MAG: hypothetical protein AB8I08_09230 [Sandaracinaceae bacterium]